jgi:hypothetical protein
MGSLFQMVRGFAFRHMADRIPLRLVEPVTDAGVASFQLKTSMACWGICGCPTFTLNTQQASVMAATSCSDVTIEEARLPFPIFGVLLSSQLHPGFEPFFLIGSFVKIREAYWRWAYPGEPFPVEEVRQNEDEQTRGEAIIIYTSAIGERMYSWQAPTLLEICHSAPGESFRGKGERVERDTQGSRWLATAAQIALGMLLSADHSGQFVGQFTERRHEDDERKELAGYDEYKFTGPINLDVRQSVRDWIDHDHWPSTVRTLVAGHWKLQPYGVARSLRKRLHIMPYWRGPLDGAVALRCPKEDPSNG